MKKKHDFDEVYDSQKLFRLVLEAMSNPTRIVNIKELADKMFGEEAEFLALALTLLDNEVSFNTCENEILSDNIVSFTLSNREKIENADFVFVSDVSELELVISNAKCGTLENPQKSATIIVKCSDENDVVIRLHGPGIKDTVDFKTCKVVKHALDIRDNQFYEYPQGLDFIFVSDTGAMFSIPRLIVKGVL